MEASEAAVRTGTFAELGRQYRDTITGWEGTCVEKRISLTGNARVILEGMHEQQGPVGYIFDQDRIEAL